MFSPENKNNDSSIEKILTPEDEMFQKILVEAESIVIDPVADRNREGKLLSEDRSAISNLQNDLYWKIIRTPTFKSWFGNSVVKDENGEPKVVYRSSLAKSFDISKGIKFKTNAQSWQENHFGTFFTSSRKMSVDFFKTVYRDKMSWYYNPEYHGAISEYESKRKAKIVEFLEQNEEQVKTWAAFIKLERPYIERGLGGGTPSIGDFKIRSNQDGEKFFEELRRNNDGLYLPRSSDYGDEYAVIKSENIFILPSDISEGVKEKERARLNVVYYSPVLRPKQNFFSNVLQSIARFKSRPTKKH